MAIGAVFTVSGMTSLLNRGFKTSPDYTVPSRFKIGTGTTTPAVADTKIETKISAWSGGSDFKNYVSGYPTFDVANQKITVQGFIASTEANGNVISEYADFNTDSAPLISSHIVFTGITKASTVQVYVTTIYKRA
jgi:hypothetical protein